jgi:phosphate-selective porin OprO/OprP
MKIRLLLGLSGMIMTLSLSAQQDNPLRIFTKKERGIELVQKDSLFSMQFQFRMQNRAAYQSISDEDFTPETFEFRTRRLRMKLKGFVYSPRLTYQLQLSFSRGDMDWEGPQNATNNVSVNIVRDAAIWYQAAPSLKLGFGQTKLPGNRQRVISSGDQQFADRSIVNAVFTIDRDFGFFGTWDKKFVILKGAITSGEGRNSNKSNKGLSYTGRVEILPLGKFTGDNDYVEGDLQREQKPKISVGASYNYNALAVRQGGQLGNDLYAPVNIQNLHLDFLFKYKGFAVYQEYCQRIADNPVTVYDTDPTLIRSVYVGFGSLTQASYLFRNNYEIAVRYAMVSPNKSIYDNPDFKTLNEKRQEHIHLGVSKYLYGHRVKLQGNLTYQTTQNLRAATKLNQVGAIFQIELGI